MKFKRKQRLQLIALEVLCNLIQLKIVAEKFYFPDFREPEQIVAPC